jgi:hypothetical protein
VARIKIVIVWLSGAFRAICLTPKLRKLPSGFGCAEEGGDFVGQVLNRDLVDNAVSVSAPSPRGGRGREHQT